jgi:ribosomal protein S18 acetylase RimI-like enzyme
MAEFRQVLSEEDIAEVVRLAREIWQEHYLPIIGQVQVDYMLETFQSRGAISRQIEQRYEYYLVLDRGQSAGYVGIVPDTGGSKLLLSKIYIRKKLRGRGLGKKALEFVEDICRQRGISIIRLTVNKNNTSSIAWYRQMGFTNIGPTVQEIGQGFVMDDFIMEKTIIRPQDSHAA